MGLMGLMGRMARRPALLRFGNPFRSSSLLSLTRLLQKDGRDEKDRRDANLVRGTAVFQQAYAGFL